MIDSIAPQPGPQYQFLETTADIAIYGGAAGGGKTFALLVEPLRHVNNPEFRAVIFRREGVQITNPGGLWDESFKIYPMLSARPRENPKLDWSFPSGAELKFSHLQLDRSTMDWQGAQIPFIGFDELTHFTENQFFYMLSRNRSTSGISGYVRATCNPDCDSWVAEFVKWWIDLETGFPIPKRSGVLRYFVRSGEKIHWGDSKEELEAQFGKDSFPKSVTFIPASVFDNKVLLEKDPAYLANLKALCRVDRERLLNGNWKIRPTGGAFFRREWFEIVEAAPNEAYSVRYWDRAGSEVSEANKDPDWTVGVKASRNRSGTIYIQDMARLRENPFKVEQSIRNTASFDSQSVKIGIEQDPGQAGKMEANYYVRQLAGFDVRCYPVQKDKVTRAKPVSAQAEAGNIKIVRGNWNRDFFEELENFPSDNGHDDIVDALSGAFQMLVNEGQAKPRVTFL